MIKAVFLIKKSPNMSTKAYRDYILKTHAPLFKQVPGVRKYVQHFVLHNPAAQPAPYDGIAEVWFEDAETMQTALQSPEAIAAQPGPNLQLTVVGLLTEEVPIKL